MKKPFFPFFSASLERKHEIVIMYFGRVSNSLVMTSERMVIPEGRFTLAQLLKTLRMRGARWADELDDRHVICSINGRAAALSDTLAAGVEVEIFSSKSVLEI